MMAPFAVVDVDPVAPIPYQRTTPHSCPQAALHRQQTSAMPLNNAEGKQRQANPLPAERLGKGRRFLLVLFLFAVEKKSTSGSAKQYYSCFVMLIKRIALRVAAQRNIFKYHRYFFRCRKEKYERMGKVVLLVLCHVDQAHSHAGGRAEKHLYIPLVLFSL